MRQVQLHEGVCCDDAQARVEIQRYLQALASYPDRFARDPDISFEKHLYSLMGVRQSSSRRQS
jgi:hypothetical protein